MGKVFGLSDLRIIEPSDYRYRTHANTEYRLSQESSEAYRPGAESNHSKR